MDVNRNKNRYSNILTCRTLDSVLISLLVEQNGNKVSVSR
jgi:hypothetical protein